MHARFTFSCLLMTGPPTRLSCTTQFEHILEIGLAGSWRWISQRDQASTVAVFFPSSFRRRVCSYFLVPGFRPSRPCHRTWLQNCNWNRCVGGTSQNGAARSQHTISSRCVRALSTGTPGAYFTMLIGYVYIVCFPGAAEATGLKDRCADLVTVAQVCM